MPWLYVFICLRVRLHSSRNGFMMLADTRSIAAAAHASLLCTLHPVLTSTHLQHKLQHSSRSSSTPTCRRQSGPGGRGHP